MDIDKRIKILKAINSNNIEKEADTFSAITSVISAAFSDVFKPEDISGSLMKIATTAVMGYFFGIWWSIATAVLQYGFDIDIGTVLTTINSLLSKFISLAFSSGKQDQINVDSASEKLADETMRVSNISGEKLEQPIGDVIASNHKNILIKEAQAGSWLAKIFGGGLKGFMTTSSGGFIKKILMTLIKGLLVGAGVGTGTVAVMNAIKSPGSSDVSSDSETDTMTPDTISDDGGPTSIMRPPTETKSKSLRAFVGPASGQGTTSHINDADKNGEGTEEWFVENKTGDFGKTIWNWIFIVYPNMREPVKDAIYDNYMHIYNSVKRAFLEYNEPRNLELAGAVVRIPKTINGRRMQSIKNVVDVILDSINV